MGGSLMLGMMPGMFDRLSLCQSADGEETEHQEDRQEFEGSVMHRRPTKCEYPYVSGRLPGLSRWRLEVGNKMKAEAEVKVEGKIQTLFLLNLDLSLPITGGLFQHSVKAAACYRIHRKDVVYCEITFGGIGVRFERQYHGHVTTQSNFWQQKRS
jgi:hypothetical protein